MRSPAAAPPELDTLLRSWLADPASPSCASPPGDARSSSAEIPLDSSYGSEQPGVYPFTRFRSARGYLDEFWVMGMYSGYGTPEETRDRFRRLLEAGQTGLSIALDLPTQMGLDSDHPLAAGEVGRVGVPLDTVDDLITVLDGLPLERVRQIRTTANAIGPIFASIALVALDELGLAPESLRLMLQNDPLKEYSARGTFIFPPPAGVRLAVDVVEYFAAHAPHWEPIEFCGYHLRDAGATATEELAIATANGIAYLDEAHRRGIPIGQIAHSLFLFLAAGVDFFEEAAKFRAARRLWARLLHQRYGVATEDAAINIFAYTLGGALTAQEPLNNVVRVAYEVLGAVLGGTQTLATSAFDEALGLPSPEAAHLALRTQQVVAYESGATKVVDPLGGSHYVEALTDALERRAVEILLTIAEHGGAVAALEDGTIGEMITSSAVRYQQQIETGERKIVGVNVAQSEAGPLRKAFRVPPKLEEIQRQSLAEAKKRRDGDAVTARLAAVARAVSAGENSVPSILEAVRARATVGELCETIGRVVGLHKATAVQL